MPNHRHLSRQSLVSVFACSALSALAVGCDGPAEPATPPSALELSAGPPEAPQTLRALGITTAELGAQNTPLYLSGHMPAAAHDGDSAAREVTRNLLAVYRLGGRDSVKPLKSGVGEDGRLYVKLQQLHGGLPVLHRDIIVQAESDGAIGAVIGELVPDLDVATDGAKLDGDAALDRAFAKLVKTGSAQVLERPSLVVYAPVAEESGAARLAYRALVTYLGESGFIFEELVVAADDGAVLGRYSQKFDALNHSVYDYKNGCLKGAVTLPGTLKRKEGDPTVTDAAVNRIYDNVGATYWYYKNYHGRDSYDGAGATLTSSAHVTFQASLTTCNGDNAAWLNAPFSQMVYGDGDGSLLLDLSLGFDVSSHELTHAVTSTTSALVYSNESGALNESMSDCLGSSAEAWQASGGSAMGNPTSITATADTWTIGEKVAGPMLPGGVLRFMYSPTLDGSSSDNYAERYVGSVDNGGVHWNSGIPNLAFYLLSQGGPHPRAKTQTVVPGIGIEKAQKIFFLANTGKNKAGVALLPSSATFQVARFSLAQAAENLYGRCSAEWQNVHMAWDAVGVGGAWSPCVQPPSGF